MSTTLHTFCTIAVPEMNGVVFGKGSGGILKVQWNCLGTESDILNCSRPLRPACGNDDPSERAAGVYCFGETTTTG